MGTGERSVGSYTNVYIVEIVDSNSGTLALEKGYGPIFIFWLMLAY
jgi:hypothetical protein